MHFFALLPAAGKIRFRLQASHFFLPRQEKVTKKNATPIPQIAATLQFPSLHENLAGRPDATSGRGRPKTAVHGRFTRKISASLGCYDGEDQKHNNTNATATRLHLASKRAFRLIWVINKFLIPLPSIQANCKDHMRKYLFLATLLLCGCVAQQKAESPSHSAQSNEQQGACIGGTSYDLCSFSVNVVERNSKPIAFVSKKSLGDDADGKPTWEILDEISLPSNMAGRFIQYASCRYSGESDDTVVALVPPHDSEAPEYIKAASWAFKVALPSGKFQELDADKVDCVNTTIGAE